MSNEDGIKIDIESPEQFEKDVEAIMEESEKLKEENKENTAEEEVKEAPEESGENLEKTGDEPAEESESGEKKKHHGKKDKKEKKDPRDERIAELEDRVKRQMAEFENFRKRTDKEKSQMFDMGAKSVVEKILPVIDNFERGLAGAPDDAFAEGMQMIYKQMTDELDKIGVKPIEAVGQPFDPNIHNAVMQTESDEYESGTVAQELQKGYMYHDTLVRPSMVSVVS